MIPPHSEPGLFEFRIARATDPSQGHTLYASHAPHASRCYVNLFCLDPKHGERFLVQSITEFVPEEFARIYNQQKPAGLENTQMFSDGRAFKIRVDDDHEVALEDWSLETYQGRIILHGKLGGRMANSVTISAGPNESMIKLPGRRPIASMTSHGSDTVVAYRRWSQDPRIRLRLLENSEGGKPGRQTWDHQVRFEPSEMRIDKLIGIETGAIRITFAEEARYRAWKYWASATSHNERKGHQGDIGEAVACAALEKSGYRVVERHMVKSERFRPRHQCRALGRDMLAVKEGQYYVAEVKHWKEYKELALKAAETELLKFADGPERDELEERLQAKIKGAIAAQLEWSYQSAEAVLHWKYVDLNAGKQRHRLRYLEPPPGHFIRSQSRSTWSVCRSPGGEGRHGR